MALFYEVRLLMIDKDDRQPHLTDQQAYELLERALGEYEALIEALGGRW